MYRLSIDQVSFFIVRHGAHVDSSLMYSNCAHCVSSLCYYLELVGTEFNFCPLGLLSEGEVISV